jgi:hypothetical protein
MVRETGWLIEAGGNAVSPVLYAAIEPKSDQWYWSAHHNAALRFARKQDAEAFCRLMRIQPLRVAEHVWMD